MTAAADTTLVVLDILGQKVFTINGDGEEVNVLRTGLDKAPDGVFIDTARGHVYATMMGTVDMKTQTSHVEDGAVWRMNLTARTRSGWSAAGSPRPPSRSPPTCRTASSTGATGKGCG